MVGERDCRTQFWKRTIQWLFHQSLVLIELLDWMVLFQNCVRQSRSPTMMAATVQLRCYWKQLWSRWAITGSCEPLVLLFVVLFVVLLFCKKSLKTPQGSPPRYNCNIVESGVKHYKPTKWFTRSRKSKDKQHDEQKNQRLTGACKFVLW
jgi:hypothetical protein